MITYYKLMEFAVHCSYYEENQDCDDRYSDNPISSHSAIVSVIPYRDLRDKAGGCIYLRAIPLNVFTLRSTYLHFDQYKVVSSLAAGWTYPSLSNIVIRVCCIVSPCTCKSANVSLPMFSVSCATRWLSLNL